MSDQSNPSIRVLPDGPYLVHGSHTRVGFDGTETAPTDAYDDRARG